MRVKNQFAISIMMFGDIMQVIYYNPAHCYIVIITTIKVGGLRLELLAQKGTQEVKYFNRKTAEENINYSFFHFSSDKPGDQLFAVPKACK